MFYQLNKGEDYDINGTNLKNWLKTYKANLTDLTLEDNGKATIENLINLCFQFRNLQSVDFTNFNTSNVTSIYQAFFGCNNITSVNGLDLPNCHNFATTFGACRNLINFPIKPKDFNDDTDYTRIYSGCTNITEDIANININNCTLNGLFERCVNVTKIYNINISNSILSKPFTNVTNITDIYDIKLNNCTWMSDLFKDMSKLQNIYNLNIDVSNQSVGDVNLTNMFYGCTILSINSYANIANNLPDAYYTKSCNISNLGLSLANFTADQIKILGNKYYIDAIPYIINSSNVSTYWNIYNGSAWTNIEKGDYDVTGTNLRSNIGSSDITIYENGNEGTLYYMTSMLSAKKHILNLNISNLKTEKVIRTDKLFQGCLNLISVSNFDTSNVITMSNMFYNCPNLASVPNFNTSNVTNMCNMFYNCSNLTSVPNFNTSNVTDMGSMFNMYTMSVNSKLSTVPQLNTSNVTTMARMFRYCNNLSDASIQNIINMCLNSNITNSTMKNLSTANIYSPLYYTKFDSTYYQNRWSELTQAGWTY